MALVTRINLVRALASRSLSAHRTTRTEAHRSDHTRDSHRCPAQSQTGFARPSLIASLQLPDGDS